MVKLNGSHPTWCPKLQQVTLPVCMYGGNLSSPPGSKRKPSFGEKSCLPTATSPSAALLLGPDVISSVLQASVRSGHCSPPSSLPSFLVLYPLLHAFPQQQPQPESTPHCPICGPPTFSVADLEVPMAAYPPEMPGI